ncbi:MAG: Gfo/Idh/MocA family oxidoreductase [Bacteroidales bacterium]|nr:Gfo/Idh/MocA family oxidoreductase [Bacteroidales bacterium]
MIRRDFLKSIGTIAAGTALSGPLLHAAPSLPGLLPDGDVHSLNDLTLPIRPLRPETDRQVSVIIIGAGNRGNVYADFARKFPEQVKVVGVSDILEHRKLRMAGQHNIPEENRFGDWSEVFTRPKFADAVVISTPDNLHYKPCMKALAMGYDVLLEKPVAQTAQECKALGAQARKYGRILAVCHVLRYAPYFLALRETVRSGAIGKLVSLQHLEPIEYAHMAHSYVRGNWRSSKETTPIILAKSCHDLDIMRWIVDAPCKTISADGSLMLFKPENAPAGATRKCTDGCPHESTCPYSALDIYTRRKQHLGVFDLDGNRDAKFIEQRLHTPPYDSYARCVYYCDNDQPDHYVTEMVFEGGVTASFSMEAFTPWGGRRTRLMGTKGYIEGNGSQFTLREFRTGKKAVWDKKVSDIAEYRGAGHGGGDHALVRDFIEAVAAQDASRLSSTIDVSIESHLMGFAAERSRKSGRKEKV